MLLPAVLPVAMLVALWLSVPWQWMWWLVCLLGAVLCWLAAWRQRARVAGFTLLSAGYVAAACYVMGLLVAAPLTADLDGAALGGRVGGSSPSGALLVAGWTLSCLMSLLLLFGAVRLGGDVWRALRRNLPWSVRPRQLLGVLAMLAVSVVLFGLMLLAGKSFAGLKTNLQMVRMLAEHDFQVFTPVRLAREVLATSYYWRTDAATPKLESFMGIPTSGYLGGADAAHAYIRAHAHPADKWSGAESYDTAFDADERAEQSDTWGLRLEQQPITVVPGNAAHGNAIQPFEDLRGVDVKNGIRHTGVITNVAPGSATALAGVQRGDTLVSVNGETYLDMVLRLVPESGLSFAADPANTASEVAAEDKAKKKVLVVRTAPGKTITVTDHKPYKTTGIQSVAWYTRGGTLVAPGLRSEVLYLRADAFTQHLGVYAEAEIRKSAQSAAQQAPISAVPDASTWPAAVLNGGVNTLIIDLRVNGGGRASAVSDLAGRLLGKYLQPGLALPATQHLDNGEVTQTPSIWFKKPNAAAAAAKTKHQSIGQPIEQTGLLRGIKTVLVLTSRETCSAPELLIYGLQKHLEGKVRFATIGDTTCGKPFGFSERDYFGASIWVVNSAFINQQGVPAYHAGIKPTCPVKELLLGPEGAWDDLVFQAAFNYAWHGRCD